MVELAKGVRDFPPEDKIFREKIIGRLRSIFETYGFSPFETPTIERLETLTAKFSGGTETDVAKEIFRLSDQGNRDLALRFDLTVPLSRFVAMNPNIRLPFKRYEIGRVFRDGPIKLGRYREFWQCDVDTIGVSSMRADAELLLLALEAFKSLKMNAYLQVNNRKLLYGLMADLNIGPDVRESVIITIDKIDKYGAEAVSKELSEKGISKNSIEKLLEIFSTKGQNDEKIESIRAILKDPIGLEGLKELEEVLSFLKFVEHGKLMFNPALARGLNYYTGTVFEGFLKDSEIKSSICGGGRYDNMIGMFGNKALPAVGISFGIEPISDAFRLKKPDVEKTVTKLFIIPIKTFKESLVIATVLREQGLSVEIDLMDRGVSKNLDYANAMGIRYVGFIGETELSEQKIKIKDMQEGSERMLTLTEVYELIEAK